MAMTPDDVLKLVKEKEVKFVDFRFTDTRGKEQHVSVPVKYFNKEKFELGHAFDGSSIAGWKGIQASAMLLMPAPPRAARPARGAPAWAPFPDGPVPKTRGAVPGADGRQALRPRPALDRQ